MKKIAKLLVCVLAAGLVNGCTSVQPPQGVSRSTLDLAVERGDTVLYVKHAQVVPVDAVKHDDPELASTQVIDWISIGGVLVREGVDGITELEKARIKLRGQLLSNGIEVMAVGFNTDEQQLQLQYTLRAMIELINESSLKSVIKPVDAVESIPGPELDNQP